MGDMAAFGADPAAITAMKEKSQCEVWPENQPIVDLFLACETQWRWVSGMAAMRVGLDYEAVRAVMDLHGIKKAQRRAVFDGVRVMETETLRLATGKGKR